jgi:hypothetical protein
MLTLLLNLGPITPVMCTGRSERPPEPGMTRAFSSCSMQPSSPSQPYGAKAAVSGHDSTSLPWVEAELTGTFVTLAYSLEEAKQMVDKIEAVCFLLKSMSGPRGAYRPSDNVLNLGRAVNNMLLRLAAVGDAATQLGYKRAISSESG